MVQQHGEMRAGVLPQASKTRVLQKILCTRIVLLERDSTLPRYPRILSRLLRRYDLLPVRSSLVVKIVRIVMSLTIPNAPNSGLFKPGYQKYGYGDPSTIRIAS